MAKEQGDFTNGQPVALDSALAAKVRAQLDRIVASPGFKGSQRRSKLLRYLVEEALADRAGSLKESVIATEVFDRDAGYDPQVDSIVRVEVGRLRSRLVEYYSQSGSEDPVQIEIPKGAYRPAFTVREPSLESAPLLAAPPTPRPFPTRMAAAAAILIVLAVAAALVWRTTRPSAPSSIAILPFLNLSGDPSSEYLGDGISEEVTEALSQSAGLRVVARTSAFQFKGKNVDMREIGQRLGAAAVLEGSIAKRGGDLHVVAQLIRTRDGYHIWSETYDAAPADLPATESRLAQAVRDKLLPADAREPGSAVTAGNPEAHDLYLRAAYEFSRRTADSSRAAIDLAKQAVAKDPTYAQPYVLMAAGESALTTLLTESPRAANERSRQDIAKALELDPTNGAALAQKAMLDYIDGWDWPQAEREFRRVLATGSHGSAENLYGWCLMTRGRFAEARRHLQRAAELDPLSLGPQLNQVEEEAYEGNLKAAQQKAETILHAAPNNPIALSAYSSLAMLQGNCQGAASSADKLKQLYPTLPFAEMAALGADSTCGRKDQAEARFATILRRQNEGQIAAYSLAMIFNFRGEADQTLNYLEKSADLREPPILYLKINHLLDNLRSTARFSALERRIGLLDEPASAQPNQQ